ncbi:MAG: cysteine hydrolase [Rhodospirillaceae bacterium]|nr:cysteine hydrolase [Rhodospirillaceae bacterium]MYB11945.1 cysteine hydrolase [Rhodospirillaceae bacterium]MYI50152.1 cysteine hydrolase [Rhodospirillaceae bacterium]
MHKTEIHPDAVRLIKARRGGRLHVHDTLDPARTALVVVDMQTAFLKPGLPSEVPMAREIVPNINRLAAAFRAAGGNVVWVTTTFDENIFTEWSSFLGGTVSPEMAKRIARQLMEGTEGHPLWPDIEAEDGDIRSVKRRFSAFIQGSSDIEAQLRARGIDTLAVTGTLTNVCCEATARDAMMRNFHVIMVADGNATYTDAIHNASLTSMSINFADVMTTDEVIGALSGAPAQAAE